MTEEEKSIDIDWTKGENIPRDAVQYWGKCKNCQHKAFVHKTAHMCSECIVKVKPDIEPSPDIVVPDSGPHGEVDAEPWEKPSELVPKTPKTPDKPAPKPEIKKTEAKKRGRPKGVKKGGFTPRTQVTKITPAKFDVAVPSGGPVGEWMFDEKKKGWVVKDEQGRSVRFSKDKPAEAK